MANEVELEKVAKAVFGITSRRYRQLANEGIVPPVIKGAIDFVAASKGIIAYYRKLAESQGSLSLTDERTALTAIKKEQEKLKLEEMRQNLVDRGQSIQWVRQLVNEARIAMLSFPRRMAEMLAPLNDAREIEYFLRSEIYKILLELSKPLNVRKHRKGIRAPSK